MFQSYSLVRGTVSAAVLASAIVAVCAGCSASTGANKNTEVGGASSTRATSTGGSSASGGAGTIGGTSGVSSSANGGTSTQSGGTSSLATSGAGSSSLAGSKATGGTSSHLTTATVGVGGTIAGAGGKSTSSSTGGITSLGGASAATGGSISAAGGNTSATGGKTSATGGVTNIGTGGTSAAPGNAIRWVGRVQPIDSSSARFAWQGAGLIANVTGSTVAVKLRTEGTSTVYFQPVVDHVAGTRFNVDQGSDRTVTIATGLGSGEHLIELYRETEGYYGLSTFLGFASGTVTGAPASNGRLLEVVGDSISAGYGNLGSEPHPNWVATPACHWTAENSSWYATYAAVAGHALGAEVSTIARSGAGMVRDLDNDPNNVLSKVYGNALGMTDTTPWSFAIKASAVVINLGTNDWANGDPGVSYESAYVQFIATVRSKYPDAWIFLVIGSMVGEPQLTEVKTRLASVVSKVQSSTGDTKLATFDLGVQDMGSDGSVPTGCDWHPNVADHERMAGILQSQLTSKLGW